MGMGNMSDPYAMTMWIHFREHEYILFKFWKSGSLGGIAVSMLITFLLCILYEAIKGMRLFLAIEHQKSRRAHAASRPRSPLAEDNSSEALLAYVLMLIVMTFNGNLILSVVVGEAIGYFLFTGTPLLDLPLQDCH